MRTPTFMRSMGTPEAMSRCMATSTSVVSGTSAMPDSMIEAGMSGMSGRLVGSNFSMAAMYLRIAWGFCGGI